jgi:hypothetical protein
MATTWLFQGNPDRFDIDGFLATRPPQTTWLVTRYADQIAPGDQVYIWRARGGGAEADSGVVAEAEVLTSPAPMQELPTEQSFWTDPAEADAIRPRVVLRFVRIAGSRSVIRRSWLREDPVLSGLPVLRMANSTNYLVTSEQAARLNALWLKTSHDWSYAEAVAGLWTYQQTHGQSVSRLPGSAVANTALLIGRAVPGVYNKVMNFRALDPRDSRAGMSATSATDRRVWDEFYDPISTSIRTEVLDGEFRRLWNSAIPGVPLDQAQASDQNFEEETKRLTERGLTELLQQYQLDSALRPQKPRARAVQATAYDRDALVAAIAKPRANFCCEIPRCPHPTFKASGGAEWYCEVHHIRPLADGGADVPENVACLCPSHHREVHYGQRAGELRQVLAQLRLG